MLLKCMDVVHNPSCRIGFLIRREKKKCLVLAPVFRGSVSRNAPKNYSKNWSLGKSDKTR